VFIISKIPALVGAVFFVGPTDQRAITNRAQRFIHNGLLPEYKQIHPGINPIKL